MTSIKPADLLEWVQNYLTSRLPKILGTDQSPQLKDLYDMYTRTQVS